MITESLCMETKDESKQPVPCNNNSDLVYIVHVHIHQFLFFTDIIF